MAHAVNRRSFLSARNSGEPLLAVYGMLVAIELGVKDERYCSTSAWKSGHDVPGFLDNYSNPGLTALSIQLRTALTNIQCTDRSGGISPVLANNYPGIRYAIHDSDVPGVGVNDATLNLLKQTLADIITQLNSAGVTI